MHMWKVESVATDANDRWEAGSQIPGGVMGDNFRLFTDFQRAFDEARKIDDTATSFVNQGYERGFFGSIFQVWLPIDELTALMNMHGEDELVAAYKFVMDD